MNERFGFINDELFVECLNDSTKLQLKTYHLGELYKIGEDFGIPFQNIQDIHFFFCASPQAMDESQIREHLCNDLPSIQAVIDAADRLVVEELTILGVVIAQANFKRKTNQTLDISQWIK